MTDATILLEPGSRASGSAFLCLPGTVVTAAHVLDGKPAENVRVRLGEGTVLPVDRVERADELDIAVLRLTAEDGRPVRAGAAGVDTRWVVTSRPKDNDPALSGRVAATRRDIVNDRGSPVSMLQLDVEQALGDFGGYSGSAVRLRDRPTTVIGVLCEQVHSRLRRGDGRRESTTVLYAVPVDAVVRRFGLAMPADRHGVSPRCGSSSRRTTPMAPTGRWPACRPTRAMPSTGSGARRRRGCAATGP